MPGVTLISVATARGVEVAGTVRAEGDLDFRGTLGVAALIETTERYCVVLQTLTSGTAVSVQTA